VFTVEDRTILAFLQVCCVYCGRQDNPSFTAGVLCLLWKTKLDQVRVNFKR